MYVYRIPTVLIGFFVWAVASLAATDAGALEIKIRQVLIEPKFIIVKETSTTGFGIDWGDFETVQGNGNTANPEFSLRFGIGNRGHSQDGYEDRNNNIGLKLNLFPRISGGAETITIDFLLEHAEMVGNVGLVGDSIVVVAPRAKTKNLETIVVVAGDEMAVVGSLQDVRNENWDNKIPLFRDVPLIGQLFKTNSTNSKKSDLVIFITPELVVDR